MGKSTIWVDVFPIGFHIGFQVNFYCHVSLLEGIMGSQKKRQNITKKSHQIQVDDTQLRTDGFSSGTDKLIGSMVS